MNLEHKIRNLTPYEVIDAMIQGLKNPSCKINMHSYGFSTEGMCFGCAATNAIQYLADKKFTPDNINSLSSRSKYLNINTRDLEYFEDAINNLRCGYISMANLYLNNLGIKPIEYNQEKDYPRLTTENYMENLHVYEHLRDQQTIKP